MTKPDSTSQPVPGSQLRSLQPGPVSEAMRQLTEDRVQSTLQSVLDSLPATSSGTAPLVDALDVPEVDAEGLRASVLAVEVAERLDWGNERGAAAGMAALMGAGEAGGGDAEVADLARAARAVVSLMDVEESPGAAIRQLVMHGQLSSSLADVMSDVLR